MRWLSKFKIIIFIGYLFCINNLAYSEEWPPDIDVILIYFNYEAGHSDDALKIEDISAPEWDVSSSDEVLYIKSQTSRKLKAAFYTDHSNIDGFAVWADKISGTGFGDLDDASADFNGTSYSTLATCGIAGSAPSSVGKQSITWRWYCTYLEGYELEEDFLIGDSQLDEYYTILAAPQSPMTEPWVEVLDYTCDWASGTTSETSALTDITEGAYAEFPVDYDGTQSHSSGTSCNLTDIIDDGWADCRDMSAVVHIFVRAIGGSNTQVRKINGAFITLTIDPIGSPGWGTTIWNFHQVAYNSNVWDACLRLDSSSPRVPVNEAINTTYKDDLFEAGTWEPQTPFNFTSVY